MAFLALVCAACLAAVFLFAWLGARRAGNAAWVDVAWAFSFLPAALICAALGSAPWPRRLTLATAVGLWSVRLGSHLAKRVARERVEDPRYQEMRRLLGPRPWAGFFWFFQAQALLVVLLGLPFYSAAMDDGPFPRMVEWLGWAVVAAGLAGEAASDRQLARFRRNPANAGKVCDTGLWAWSRHPNYFFEWVVWVGFGLLGFAGPAGWWVWLAPAVMLLLLTKVTGIPPAEARSISSRGEAYREYQKRVSAFFPLPPRR